MTNQNISDIIKMRMSVYRAGVKAGFWNDIDQSGASDMMIYLFPNSGQIAYYNLVLESMRKEHEMCMGGVYTLFKMPVQIEKEVMEFLKKKKCDLSLDDTDCDSYLQSMDTIVTDHGFMPVSIGLFNVHEIDSILRLCASHYRFSFANNVKSFPYMS